MSAVQQLRQRMGVATTSAAGTSASQSPSSAAPAPLSPPAASVGTGILQAQLNTAVQQGAAQAQSTVQQQLMAAIEGLNAEYFVAPEGGKVSVWRESIDPELNRATLTPMSPTDFRALYQNPTFTLTNSANNSVTVSLGAAWFKSDRRREYVNGLALLPGMDTPSGVYNLWRSWGINPVAGDVEMALWHIKHVICAGDALLTLFVVRWMAWCVQNPAKQAEVALVLQGKKGTGKGTLGRWMLEIFGMHGLHILHRRHLVGNFNAHLRLLCFAFADEAFFAGDHEGQAVMKGLITEDQITIERKGVDAFAVRNRLKVMMATNEKWVVPASEDERRYCVVEVSDAKRGNHEYFAQLDKHMRNGGLAALLDYLLNLDLSEFNIRAVPNTEALEKQKLLSLPPFKAWLYERLWEGVVAPFDTEWKPEQNRESLANQFAEHVRSKGLRFVATDTKTLGVELREIFPTMGERRDSTDKVTKKRPWLWLLPTLEEAREQFAQHVGLEFTGWPEIEA